MPAKGSSTWYADRRQQPSTKTIAAKPAPRQTMVTCPNQACGLTYLSYHVKCPFCGVAAPSKL